MPIAQHAWMDFSVLVVLQVIIYIRRRNPPGLSGVDLPVTCDVRVTTGRQWRLGMARGYESRRRRRSTSSLSKTRGHVQTRRCLGKHQGGRFSAG
jgi:hypothetical protein